MVDILDLSIKISDIPSEHMQMVAYQCGVSVSISLMQNVPGLELYIPISSKKAIQRNYISDKYTGSNSASIGIHLGLDSEKVKKIAKKHCLNNAKAPLFTTEDMSIVAVKCGEEVAFSLVENFSNQTLYVPKNGLSTAIKKYIIQNCTGFNVANLAIKCGVTERYVRKIMAQQKSTAIQCCLDLKT